MKNIINYKLLIFRVKLLVTEQDVNAIYLPVGMRKGIKPLGKLLDYICHNMLYLY